MFTQALQKTDTREQRNGRNKLTNYEIKKIKTEKKKRTDTERQNRKMLSRANSKHNGRKC